MIFLQLKLSLVNGIHWKAYQMWQTLCHPSQKVEKQACVELQGHKVKPQMLGIH